MCVAFLELSVLFLHVTWCPAPCEPRAASAIETPGVHVHITPQAVEFSIRLRRAAAAH